MEKIEFKNLSELKNKSLKLDIAEYRDIYDKDKKRNEKFVEIFNITKQNSVKIIKRTTKPLIQHRDLINTFIDRCLSLNLSLKGEIIDFGNKFTIKTYHNNKKININKDDIITPGLFLTNDYGSKPSISWYGGRLACMNDMAINSIKSPINIHTIDALTMCVEESIKNITEKDSMFQKQVNIAIEDIIPIETAKLFINFLIKSHYCAICKEEFHTNEEKLIDEYIEIYTKECL